jgi:hypothetical protein
LNVNCSFYLYRTFQKPSAEDATNPRHFTTMRKYADTSEAYKGEPKPLISSRPRRTGPISWAVTFTRVSNGSQPNVEVHQLTGNITFFLINVTLLEFVFFVFPVVEVVDVLEKFYPDIPKPIVHLAMAVMT